MPVYHRNVVFLWGVRREADQGHNLGGASVDEGGQHCQSDTLGSAGMTVFASIAQMGDQVERVSGDLTNSTLTEVLGFSWFLRAVWSAREMESWVHLVISRNCLQRRTSSRPEDFLLLTFCRPSQTGQKMSSWSWRADWICCLLLRHAATVFLVTLLNAQLVVSFWMHSSL